MKYLSVLEQSIMFIITAFWIYNIGISVCAFIKFKDKPLKINKNHKVFSFMIFLLKTLFGLNKVIIVII